jgi:uncharacterized protein YqeY
MASALLDTMLNDIKELMRARETDKLTALRMLHSEIKNLTVNAGKEPTDEDVIGAVSKAIKQRTEAMEQFTAGGRQDLAQKEQAEIELFRRYQPKQLDVAEIEALARKCIAELGATSKKDMGKVMQALMPQVKGRSDGKVVNQVVMGLLS